jgi:hypothetical protein
MNKYELYPDEQIAWLIEKLNFHPLTAFIYIKYDGRCFYCGKKLLETDLEYSKFMDWVLPKTRNPEPEWDENNLVLGCFSCNSKNGDSDRFNMAGKNPPEILQRCNEFLIDIIFHELSTHQPRTIHRNHLQMDTLDSWY